MTCEIMSPKLGNGEESGYIGAKSSDEPHHPAVVEDPEEVSINLKLYLE